MMQKVETPNHTPERVREIIEEAWTIANELSVDQQGKRLVFEQACQLLGQKSVVFIEAQPTPLLLDGMPRPR